MIYVQLFWAFLQIGLFSIGGGLASLHLIEHQAVDLHGWLTMEEYADVLTISEMTPGPIGINSATFVGMHTAGLPGAVVATVACIIPSCIIVTLLAWVYKKYNSLRTVKAVIGGIRPAVTAMIASAALSMILMCLYGTKEIPADFLSVRIVPAILFVISLVSMRLFRPSPIAVMVSAGAANLIIKLIA